VKCAHPLRFLCPFICYGGLADIPCQKPLTLFTAFSFFSFFLLPAKGKRRTIKISANKKTFCLVSLFGPQHTLKNASILSEFCMAHV
jgi:hypothetical protein